MTRIGNNLLPSPSSTYSAAQGYPPKPASMRLNIEPGNGSSNASGSKDDRENNDWNWTLIGAEILAGLIALGQGISRLRPRNIGKVFTSQPSNIENKVQGEKVFYIPGTAQNSKVVNEHSQILANELNREVVAINMGSFSEKWGVGGAALDYAQTGLSMLNTWMGGYSPFGEGRRHFGKLLNKTLKADIEANHGKEVSFITYSSGGLTLNRVLDNLFQHIKKAVIVACPMSQSAFESLSTKNPQTKILNIANPGDPVVAFQNGHIKAGFTAASTYRKNGASEHSFDSYVPEIKAAFA